MCGFKLQYHLTLYYWTLINIIFDMVKQRKRMVRNMLAIKITNFPAMYLEK